MNSSHNINHDDINENDSSNKNIGHINISNSNEIMMALQKTCKKDKFWEGLLSCIGCDLAFINRVVLTSSRRAHICSYTTARAGQAAQHRHEALIAHLNIHMMYGRR